MRAPRKHRPSRSSAGWLGRDRWRALAACLCVACLVAVGVSMRDWSFLANWSPSSPSSKSTQQAQAGDEFATGSIVVVPLRGELCRHLVIENATWRIRDGGLVDCHTVLLQSAGPRHLSAARAELFRTVFGRR
jgi:hypothetical protein